jgi:hypothetical protein
VLKPLIEKGQLEGYNINPGMRRLSTAMQGWKKVMWR